MLNPKQSSRGLQVVVLGIDGSGKSTLIKALAQHYQAHFTKVNTLHFRPNCLAKKHTVATQPLAHSPDPHAKKTKNFYKSFLRLLYFWFDYSFGYFLTIKPKLKKKELVIFDRYFFDLYVDPKRYRYGAPLWSVQWVLQLIPQPDLILLLNVSPEVARQRKAELSLSESQRQCQAYIELMANRGNAVVLDANQTAVQLKKLAQQTIDHYLARREHNGPY